MFTLSNSDSTSVGTAWALRMLCFSHSFIGLHLSFFEFSCKKCMKAKVKQWENFDMGAMERHERGYPHINLQISRIGEKTTSL
jgi:hypothetical protein